MVPSYYRAPLAVAMPLQVAASRASECIPRRLDAGARMEVFPLVDDRLVLRVPRRTEQQLIAEFGSTGRQALATGHEVSNVTETELKDLEAMSGYIGAFVPATTPFADLDLEGNFRYYSLQRRVSVATDLRNCTDRLEGRHSQRSLERFIRDVRDMVENLQLMPDLAGRGNLVVDRAGFVKLIDINNFRRTVSDAEVEQALPPADEFDDYVFGRRDISERLPSDFVDDLGHPIHDLSLHQLRKLEIRGLGRDHKALDHDPFYAPLFNPRRRQVLALLRTDVA